MDPSSVAGWDCIPRKPPNGASTGPPRVATDNVQTMLAADLGRQEGGLEVGLGNVNPTTHTGVLLSKTTTGSTNAQGTPPPISPARAVPHALLFTPNLDSSLHQMDTRTHRHTPSRNETRLPSLTASRAVAPSTPRIESAPSHATPTTHPLRTPLRVQTAVPMTPQAEPYSVHTEDADGEDEDDIIILESHKPPYSCPIAIIDLTDGESDAGSVEILATIINNAPVSSSSTSTGVSKPRSSPLFSSSPILTPLTPPPPERLFTPDPSPLPSKHNPVPSPMQTTQQPRSRSVSVISLRTTPSALTPPPSPPRPLSPTLSPPPESMVSSSKLPYSTTPVNTKKRKRKTTPYVSVPFLSPTTRRSYTPAERVLVLRAPDVDAVSTLGAKATFSTYDRTLRDASQQGSGTGKGKEKADKDTDRGVVRSLKPISSTLSSPSSAQRNANVKPQAGTSRKGKTKEGKTTQPGGNGSLIDAMNASFAPIVIADDEDEGWLPSSSAKKKAKLSAGVSVSGVGEVAPLVQSGQNEMVKGKGKAKANAKEGQAVRGSMGATGRKRRRTGGGSGDEFELSEDEVGRLKKKRRAHKQGDDGGDAEVVQMEVIELDDDSGSDSDFEVLGMIIGGEVKRQGGKAVVSNLANSTPKPVSNASISTSLKPSSSSTKKRLVKASDLPIQSSSGMPSTPSKPPRSTTTNATPSRPSGSQSQLRTTLPPSSSTQSGSSRPPMSSTAHAVPPATVSPTRSRPRPIFKAKATGVPYETRTGSSTSSGARLGDMAERVVSQVHHSTSTPVDNKSMPPTTTPRTSTTNKAATPQRSSSSGRRSRPRAEVYIPVLVRSSASRAASVTTLSLSPVPPSFHPPPSTPPPSESAPSALPQPQPSVQPHILPPSENERIPSPAPLPPPSIIITQPLSQADRTPQGVPLGRSPPRRHSSSPLADFLQVELLSSGVSDFLQYPARDAHDTASSHGDGAGISPPEPPAPPPSAPLPTEPLFLPSSTPTRKMATPPPLDLSTPELLGPPPPAPAPPPPSSQEQERHSVVLHTAPSPAHPPTHQMNVGPEEPKFLILDDEPYESEEILRENVRFLNASLGKGPVDRDTDGTKKNEEQNGIGLGVGLKGRKCLFEDPLLPLGIFGGGKELDATQTEGEVYYLGRGLFWGDTVLAIEPIQTHLVSATPSSSSLVPGASMGDRGDMASVRKVDFLQLNKAKKAKGKAKAGDGIQFSPGGPKRVSTKATSKEKTKDKSSKKTTKNVPTVQDSILPEFQVGGSAPLFDPALDLGEQYFLQEAFGPPLPPLGSLHPLPSTLTSPTAHRHRNVHAPTTSAANRSQDDDILKELSLHDPGSFEGGGQVSIGLMDDGSNRWFASYDPSGSGVSSSAGGDGETVDPMMLFGGGGVEDDDGDEAMEVEEVATTLGTISEPEDRSSVVGSTRDGGPGDEAGSSSESDAPLRVRFGPPGAVKKGKAAAAIPLRTSKKSTRPPRRAIPTRHSSSSSETDESEAEAAQILGRGRRTVKRPARYRHGFVTHDGLNLLSDTEDDKPVTSHGPRPGPSTMVDDESDDESSDDSEAWKVIREAEGDDESVSNFSEASSVLRKKRKKRPVVVRRVVAVDPESSSSDDSDDDDDVPFASQTQASKVLIGPPVGSRPLTNVSRSFQRQYPTDAEATYCHQCRRKTNMAKVVCGRCDKRFCRRCLDIRYPDRQFEKATFEPARCPGCEMYCNCTACCRKRGEVYISSVNPNRTGGEAPSQKNTVKAKRESRPVVKALLSAPTSSNKDDRTARSRSRRQQDDGAESDDSTANYPMLRLPSAYAAPPPASLAYWGVIYDLKGAKIGAGFVEPGLMLPKIVHAAAVDSSAEGKKGLLDENQIHEGIGQPRLKLMPPHGHIPPSVDRDIPRSPSPGRLSSPLSSLPQTPPPPPQTNVPLLPTVAEALASIVARPKRIIKKTSDGPKRKFVFVGRLQRSWKARLTDSKRNKEPKVKHGFVGRRWPLRMQNSNEAAHNPDFDSDAAEEDELEQDDDDDDGSVRDGADVDGFDHDDSAGVDAGLDDLDYSVYDTGIELPPASPMSYSQFDDVDPEPRVQVPLSNEDVARAILLALSAINVPLSAVEPLRTAPDVAPQPPPEPESAAPQPEIPCIVPAADKGIATTEPEPMIQLEPSALANDNSSSAAPASNLSTAG